MNSGKGIAISLLLAASFALGGCFTGVESTPRIDATHVKRERAAGTTPEQQYLSDIKPLPPKEWQPGKMFRITDDRISRIFTSHSAGAEALKGNDLFFERIVPARSLTGNDATELQFATTDGRRFNYRINGISYERMDTLSSLEVPFTIDMQLVEAVDSKIRDKEFYIKTSAWYGIDGQRKENGLRHILVHIDSVVAGDAYFPTLVCFSVVNSEIRRRLGESQHAVYMSVGTSKSATRNFDVLFAFESPRKAHPEIKDDVWELIISSKVREGMSRDECRLALGTAPEVLRTPTYSGMREVWSYSDGVFLIFDDGYLTRFRL